MAETSTIFGFMKYVSATDILSDFKKTVDSHFVNNLKEVITHFLMPLQDLFYLQSWMESNLQESLILNQLKSRIQLH